MVLLEKKAEVRKIGLFLELDEGIAKPFHTDPRRLKQVLLNLAGNALKFTFEGYVKIKASLSKDSKSKQQCILIDIIDTGLGITKKQLPKLFRLFGTLEETKKVNQTGTGIGLVISNTIARRLCPEMHDDKVNAIVVKSTPGVKTVFSFVIEDKHPKESKLDLENEFSE